MLWLFVLFWALEPLLVLGSVSVGIGWFVKEIGRR